MFWLLIVNYYLRRMSKKPPINLRSFKARVKHTKTAMRRYLSKIDRNRPRGLDATIAGLEKQVWKEIDCLSCANCCKTMTPTYTPADLKRISAHFNLTVDGFKEKYLKQERGGPRDWMNKKQPCQFLNLKDNKCSIYAIRPADCAGFPHLTKKFKEYVHIHKQNVEYCPATHRLVEKMMEAVV
jgi:uncharacterized protein